MSKFCKAKLEVKRTIATFVSLSDNRKRCSKTDNVEATGILYATCVPGMGVFSLVKQICTNNFGKVVYYDNNYKQIYIIMLAAIGCHRW